MTSCRSRTRVRRWPRLKVPFHLRQVPPGRHAGAAKPEHSRARHSGQLFREHSRRRAAEERPYGRRPTALLATRPTASCRTPTRIRRSPAGTLPPPARSATRRSRRCTARPSAASCGRRRPTCCRPALIATSPTRCARSSTRKAWRMPTACAAMANERLKAGDGRVLAVHTARTGWFAPRQESPAASAIRKSTPRALRPCETITKKVDCTSCHAEVGQQYQRSVHGQLFAKSDSNAPSCKECHGTHHVLGKHESGVGHFSHQRAWAVRALPSRGRKGGGALQGAAA